MRKYYSVSEAEDSIQFLEPRLINLMKLSKAIDLLDAIEIEYDDEYETIQKDVLMNKKFHEYSLKFCKEIEKLLSQGVILKDIEEGIINFFSVHNNEEIFLCWKLGDKKIDSWYPAGSDFEFRRPISDLKKKKV